MRCMVSSSCTVTPFHLRRSHAFGTPELLAKASRPARPASSWHRFLALPNKHAQPGCCSPLGTSVAQSFACQVRARDPQPTRGVIVLGQPCSSIHCTSRTPCVRSVPMECQGSHGNACAMLRSRLASVYSARTPHVGVLQLLARSLVTQPCQAVSGNYSRKTS